MSDTEYAELQCALVATLMEGYNSMERSERDCAWLMSGEKSVKDSVGGILRRPAKAGDAE